MREGELQRKYPFVRSFVRLDFSHPLPPASPPPHLPGVSSWKISRNYRVTGFEKSQELSGARRPAGSGVVTL